MTQPSLQTAVADLILFYREMTPASLDRLRQLARPDLHFRDPFNVLNQNGIVFFPGSVGLYRNGALVGGLGVSGDGVDQDDYVTAGGAAGFEAPVQIRADQVLIGGVRLPYLLFPRNPTN